ncbi:MAG: ADP-ribosylglycohydrolase family protein [Verrucomicrobiae bacterium]|nr:ADP-ribosylglycohydrolase family protein [Verrucomicrobiae bacterium]
MDPVTDRCRGALLGLAVGDAVGTTLEFRQPGTFEPIDHMVGGGPFNLEPGQWTDDTSMALCLATSLVEKGGFDARDQMERYCRWWREGYLSSTGACFDIGSTVRSALRRFEDTGEPFAGSTDPQSAGNGSLMRLAPVPICFAKCPDRAIEMAGESSRTTHGAPAAVDACRYLAGLIVGAIHGTSKDDILSPLYAPIPGFWEQHPLCPQIREIAEGSFKRKSPPAIRGAGYVVKSLEAALWAFHHGKDFREGCVMAANLGDDADTTAAIFGQIAGAFYGMAGIPVEWLGRLHDGDSIVALAARLAGGDGTRG